MARVLTILGVDMGRRFISANESNPKGYWEHADIMALHLQLREVMGLHWDYISPLPEQWWSNEEIKRVRQQIVDILKRDFRDSPFWGIKENRLSRYIELWKPIFHDVSCRPHFLIMFRHPAEVAASFYRMENLPMAKGFAIWMLRNLDAEKATRPYSRSFVSFDSLLIDWRKTVRRIAGDLNIEWPREIAEVEREIDEFLEPRLRHHKVAGNSSTVVARVPTMLENLYTALREAESGDTADIQSAFDEARISIEEQTGTVYTQSLISHIQTLDRTIKELTNSRSWRFTQPLRSAVDFWNRLRS